MFELTDKQTKIALVLARSVAACTGTFACTACEERDYWMGAADAAVASAGSDAGREPRTAPGSSATPRHESTPSSPPPTLSPSAKDAGSVSDAGEGSSNGSAPRATTALSSSGIVSRESAASAPNTSGREGGSIDGGAIDGGAIDGGAIDGGAIDGGASVPAPSAAEASTIIDAGSSDSVTSGETSRAVDTVGPVTCDGVPLDASRECSTPELGCAGTQVCTPSGWSTCVSLDSGCVCSNGATTTCTGSHGCDGTQACSGNRWEDCVCNDPTWKCTPQSPDDCVSAEGCEGYKYCDGYGHWSETCVAPNRCPSGFRSTPYDCAWTSAYQGAHIDWDEYLCPSNTSCTDIALDTVPPGGGQSQAMYLEVRLAQAGPCDTGESHHAWVGCHHPGTGEEYGRDVADVEFNNQVTLPLRCAAGSHLIVYKTGPAGSDGCWRAYDIVVANNHDPIAEQCAY